MSRGNLVGSRDQLVEELLPLGLAVVSSVIALAEELQVPSDADPVVAQLVAEDLRQVGIDLRLAPLGATDADAAAVSGAYQLTLVGYGSLGGDPDWLRIRLSPSVQVRTQARVHGYHDRRFEALASRQCVTTDPDQRRRLVREMQWVVAGDVPFLHLYVPDRAVFFDRQVFDAWYFTPGGVAGAYPGPLNKHALVTGTRTGRPPPVTVPQEITPPLLPG